MKIAVPYFRQKKTTTCGPACLRMLLALNGIADSENEIEEACDTSWLGNTCEEIANGAKDYRLHAEIIENIDIETLKRLLKDGYPLIALLDPAILYGGVKGFGHFVVVVGYDDSLIYYHDPDLDSEKVMKTSTFFRAWSEFFRKGIKVWKSMKK